MRPVDYPFNQTDEGEVRAVVLAPGALGVIVWARPQQQMIVTGILWQTEVPPTGIFVEIRIGVCSLWRGVVPLGACESLHQAIQDQALLVGDRMPRPDLLHCQAGQYVTLGLSNTTDKPWTFVGSVKGLVE